MILNQNGKEIVNPDLTVGRLESKSLSILCEWVVDKESVGHYEVIAEYPNGGKDVKWIVDEPEEGYWEITPEQDIDNDYSVPENASTHEKFYDIWEYQEYVPYTDEELAGLKAEEEARTLAEAEAQERQAFQDNLPTALSEIDEAICTLYELTLEV